MAKVTVDQIEYDSKEILGQGGFAIVFKGRFGDQRVAVKRIQIEGVDSSREDEFLKKHPHPNILKVFHVEEDSHFRQANVFDFSSLYFEPQSNLIICGQNPIWHHVNIACNQIYIFVYIKLRRSKW